MLDLAVTIPAYKSSVYLLDEPVFKIAQINKKDLLFGNAIREFTEFIFLVSQSTCVRWSSKRSCYTCF